MYSAVSDSISVSAPQQEVQALQIEQQVGEQQDATAQSPEAQTLAEAPVYRPVYKKHLSDAYRYTFVALEPLSRNADNAVVTDADDTGADEGVITLADSLAAELPHTGIVLVHESEGIKAEARQTPAGGYDWLLAGVLLVFVAVALRFRNNSKYLHTLIFNLTDVRERHNAFDDTFRESSFLLLLNVLGAISTGILLYILTISHLGASSESAINAAKCIGIMGVYTLLMPMLYWMTGRIFLGRRRTSMWLQGVGASNAILGILLLAPVLVAMLVASLRAPLLIASAVIFSAVKLVFIFKSLRIFIRQFSSWVVFLYYLCSLEIVPLVAVYAAAIYLCG